VDPLDEAEVYRRSDKLVLLVDVGGHERYLRTALRGLFSSQPDYVMFGGGGQLGGSEDDEEHLGIAVGVGDAGLRRGHEGRHRASRVFQRL
jgi:translation elongation factor 1A GTP binding domain family